MIISVKFLYIISLFTVKMNLIIIKVSLIITKSKKPASFPQIGGNFKNLYNKDKMELFHPLDTVVC